MRRAVWTTVAGLLLIGTAVAALSACSGEDVMATIGMPTTESAPAHGTSDAAPPGPPPAGGQSNALVVTDRQRGYLDALTAAGVEPSSDLLALSIGSYVCQARAARHDDQEVWDSVYPLVRSDVTDRMAPPAPDVNAVTSDYIRIASDRLC
ncbi:DUF732 domain-containing protein [Mycobacterium sp. B14F4]|uniref:DUF732 domain-containing protein n=1 Tax=Mycobacterium sp. B14F4 TaxID=3153565 RepID=UPI00325D8145